MAGAGTTLLVRMEDASERTMTVGCTERAVAVAAHRGPRAPGYRRGPPLAPAGPARRADWVPWLIALAVFAAYATISLSRYLQLAPGSWDLGIFTEYVRQLAHLHAPVVNIRGAGFNLLGDHFQPIVGADRPGVPALPQRRPPCSWSRPC